MEQLFLFSWFNFTFLCGIIKLDMINVSRSIPAMDKTQLESIAVSFHQLPGFKPALVISKGGAGRFFIFQFLILIVFYTLAMQIYKADNKKLARIKEKAIDLERDIQTLTQDNLEEIFGYTFIRSEFSLQNYRIDTLAFNPLTNSFVIIEYKRDKNFTVIDQGFTYLGLMLNNPSEFILEYQERTGKRLRRDDVDWHQPKVIFIVPSYTQYQQGAIAFNDLPIELWEVKVYEGGYVAYNQLKPPVSSASIKSLSIKNNIFKQVSEEVKSYGIDDHFKEGWNESRALFDILIEQVQAIDTQIEVHAVKSYIGFTINGKIFVSVRPRANKLHLEFSRTRPEDVSDPQHKLEYQQNSMQYYHQHVSQMDISSENEVRYAVKIAEEVYQHTI